jgi:hypothetical protein
VEVPEDPEEAAESEELEAEDAAAITPPVAKLHEELSISRHPAQAATTRRIGCMGCLNASMPSSTDRCRKGSALQ